MTMAVAASVITTTNSTMATPITTTSTLGSNPSKEISSNLFMNQRNAHLAQHDVCLISVNFYELTI